MKEIRSDAFTAVFGEMENTVKMSVFIFRQIKPYFANENDVEEDIQEYIEKSFDDLKEFYDLSMQEIIWTMDFLLSNPNLSATKEIEDLKSFLTNFEFDLNIGIHEFQQFLCETYEKNLLRQLPEKISNDFNLKIHYEDYYVNVDLDNIDLKDFWYPFENPNLLEEEDFEDDFTMYLEMLSENIICKGKQCGRKFKSFTILKHLNHPSVTCKKDYDHSEIMELENDSKLRLQTKMHNWKEIKRPIMKNNIEIEENINNGFWEEKFKIKRYDTKMLDHLIEVQSLLKSKCMNEACAREDQLLYAMNKLVKTSSYFSNDQDVKENIDEWYEEIMAEIKDTFEHLDKEINRKFDFYLATPAWRNWDRINPRPSFATLQYNAKELLHYINWRHENSNLMVCEMISLIAKNIQNQIINSADFPKQVIKKPDLNDGYQILSYDQIPDYDPTEGIKVYPDPIMYHPKDHPNYPHYCYPVFKIQYTAWLAETCVVEEGYSFEDSKNSFRGKNQLKHCFSQVLSGSKAKLCVCNKEYGIGACNIKCNFDENNPGKGCNYYPKCLGCLQTIDLYNCDPFVGSSQKGVFRNKEFNDNGTIYQMAKNINVTNFQMHFRKNTLCYNAYSYEAFVKMEIQIKEVMIAVQEEMWQELYPSELEIVRSGKIQCRGCKNGFEFWEIMKHVNKKCLSKFYASYSFFSSMYYIDLWNSVVLTRDRNAYYEGHLIRTLDDFVTDSNKARQSQDQRVKGWDQLATTLEEHRAGHGPEWPNELKF